MLSPASPSDARSPHAACCHCPHTQPETADPASSTLTVTTAFGLHSRPSATKKIFLNFKGATTSGTAWNSGFTAGAPIVTPAFDTNGDGASWSASELAVVYSVWRAVSEDYSVFHVDVTTEDPALSNIAATNYITALIGGDGACELCGRWHSWGVTWASPTGPKAMGWTGWWR